MDYHIGAATLSRSAESVETALEDRVRSRGLPGGRTQLPGES